MITARILSVDVDTQKSYIEGECLSTDVKPTVYANGSKLLEINTSKLFIYDEANNVWREWV